MWLHLHRDELLAVSLVLQHGHLFLNRFDRHLVQGLGAAGLSSDCGTGEFLDPITELLEPILAIALGKDVSMMKVVAADSLTDGQVVEELGALLHVGAQDVHRVGRVEPVVIVASLGEAADLLVALVVLFVVEQRQLQKVLKMLN